MGFFDFLKPVVDIAGAILGVPAATTTVARQPPATVGEARQRGITPPGITRVRAPVVDPTGACPVQGTLRRRTIVETFDPETGVVCKMEVFKGAPAVMQSDVAASNRLNRALRRLNKSQPKRLVKQSTAARLKDDLIEGALRRAGQECPNPNGS